MVEDQVGPDVSGRIALVLGVAGQDGFYLARHLVERGYGVVGFGRGRRPQDLATEVVYRTVDLRDALQLERALGELRPDLVIHVAAVHSSAGSSYETVWQDMLAVNTASVHVVLEYLRTQDPSARFVYASSGKVFSPVDGVLTETSPMHPTCLYSLTKISTQDLIEIYRRKHGLSASVVYLFNHESERRPPHFFTSKVVTALAGALAGARPETEVESLDFYCDWGGASEYMEIMVDIAEQVVDDDFVLGRGVTWLGREFVETLFARHGLRAATHVRERAQPRDAGPQFTVSTEKLARMIGRVPQEGVMEVCDRMLAVELAAGERQT